MLGVFSSQVSGHENIRIFAGIGVAIVGSLSTFIALPFGTIIDQSYDSTVIPFIVGLLILSGISNLNVHWTESREDCKVEETAVVQ